MWRRTTGCGVRVAMCMGALVWLCAMSCRGAQPVSTRAEIQEHPSPRDEPVVSTQQVIHSEPPVFVSGVEDAQERESFARLVDEVNQVLKSARFKRNLESLGSNYPAVFIHYVGSGTPDDPYNAVMAPVDVITSSVRGERHRYVKSPAVLVGDAEDRTALSGWTGTAAQQGRVDIGRFHLERWESEDLVERSCAVNTMAHEMIHLISNREDIFMTHFIDDMAASFTSRDAQGDPIVPPLAVASYLIGSVAQCTWLQEHYGQDDLDLEICVEVFGHRSYNSLRCTSFVGGRPVEMREDLPEAHVLTD